MILKNAIKITAPYQGKSKFDFFTNLKAGDIVIVSIKTAQKLQGASNGLYATMVKMKMKETGQEVSVSMTDFEKYLSKIPHIEAQEFFSKDVVTAMLEDIYAETAGGYNDYGKDKKDYLESAKTYIRSYMEKMTS